LAKSTQPIGARIPVEGNLAEGDGVTAKLLPGTGTKLLILLTTKKPATTAAVPITLNESFEPNILLISINFVFVSNQADFGLI
jgi:hypothetical protein